MYFAIHQPELTHMQLRLTSIIYKPPYRTPLPFNLPIRSTWLRLKAHLLRRHMPRRTSIELSLLSAKRALRCRWWRRRPIPIAISRWLLELLSLLSKETKSLKCQSQHEHLALTTFREDGQGYVLTIFDTPKHPTTSTKVKIIAFQLIGSMNEL